MTLPRMRTIPKAIEELKAIDPDTALSRKGLDRLIKQGRIPVVYIESRRLVDLNAICDYLAHPDREAPAPELEPMNIHPISVG